MPADILYITSEQSVVLGADIILNCWSKGVPAPDVTWTRNEEVLETGERTAMLKLDNVTRQDEGLYSCRANNSQGSDNGDTKVNVVGEDLKLILEIFNNYPANSCLVICLKNRNKVSCYVFSFVFFTRLSIVVHLLFWNQ